MTLAQDKRVPCPQCGEAIIEGARKCKRCRQWLPSTTRPPFPYPRAAIIIASAVATVFSVIVTSRKSRVGEAPPLSAVLADSAVENVPPPPPPGVGDPAVPPAPPPPGEPKASWSSRTMLIGDIHPLDVIVHPSGQSVFVSGDDATLREYKLDTGELIHQASTPAKGDELRLLHDRYVALLRHHPGVSRIPIMDTERWDRDPLLLTVGLGPSDAVGLADGETIVTSSGRGRRVSRFKLPDGDLIDDITLPQATHQLLVVQAESRPYLAALGSQTYTGRPAGAWLDLFDPEESPFGATRRSISVGRDARPGAVTRTGQTVVVPDHASNEATILTVNATTEVTRLTVGSGPNAAFVLAGDRYAVTLDDEANSATVIDLEKREVHATLMLDGPPRMGRMAPNREALFVTLGGTEIPPRGSGAAVIGGNPPRIIATLETGKGARSVAVSKDGERAVVTNYFDKSLTIIE